MSSEHVHEAVTETDAMQQFKTGFSEAFVVEVQLLEKVLEQNAVLLSQLLEGVPIADADETLLERCVTAEADRCVRCSGKSDAQIPYSTLNRERALRLVGVREAMYRDELAKRDAEITRLVDLLREEQAHQGYTH